MEHLHLFHNWHRTSKAGYTGHVHRIECKNRAFVWFYRYFPSKIDSCCISTICRSFDACQLFRARFWHWVLLFANADAVRIDWAVASYCSFCRRSDLFGLSSIAFHLIGRHFGAIQLHYYLWHWHYMRAFGVSSHSSYALWLHQLG